MTRLVAAITLALGAGAPLACSWLVDIDHLAGPPAASGDATVGDERAIVVDGAARGETADAVTDVGTVDPHLLGAWSFEEGGGNLAKSATSSSYDGRLEGDATLGAGGHSGGALLLAGKGGMVVDGLEGALFPKTGTLTMWIKSDRPSDDPAVVSVFDAWDTSRPHLFIRTGERWQVGMMGPGDTYAFFVYFDMPGDWAHLAVSWEEATRRVRLYVGGRLIVDGTYDSAFSPTGQRTRFGYGFEGRIDEVKVYDRALSEIEVAAMP